MNLTKEDQACLIEYSRQQQNLPIALAIWSIQEDLRNAIITEFLTELQEYVENGLEQENLPWCVAAPLNQSEWKKNDILILSITREESNREIGLYKWKETQEWETYLGGKCNDDPALTPEQLEPALVGVGTGRRYGSHGFEWSGNIENNYRDLGSDEALTTMNMENGRQEFVEHYGEVLLRAVIVTEELLD
ncbi:MAG: hypothetical protein OXH81_20470 [Gemmatimonadetes bacterium]|nr:hypothetical protein [Gemmatimonadota bacterium]